MKAVIFDMDGVIVDTMDIHKEATINAFSENGFNITHKQLSQFDGMKSSEAFKNLFETKADEEIEEMISKKYEVLKKRTSGIIPYSGFLSFFFKLKNKFPLAVCSSSRRTFVEYILEQINERNSFKILVGAEDVSRGKPNPEPYLKTAELLNVNPKDCLVIEDSVAGIISAKKAGMKCIAVTNTFDRNFLLDADLVVDSLAEVSLEQAMGLFKN